jgi:acylglycerol lipase
MRHLLLLCLLALGGVVQCAHNGARPQPARLSMDTASSTWAPRDGKVLPFTRWPGGPESIRGVVICIHGLSGAASDFWPIGDSIPATGFTVYGLQLRGQGNDPDIKKRGDIRSRKQWLEDLQDFTALVKRRHSGTPVYWYGESLGALIAIHSAAGPAKPDGIILSSPVIELRPALQLGLFKNIAFRAMLNFLPGTQISLESFGNSNIQVTSHTTHSGQMQHTAHYVPAFTFRLFAEIEQLIKTVPAAAAELHVPILVLYTPHDPLVSREAVEHFYDLIPAREKTKVFFPNSYHLILHDTERARAVQTVRDWLNRRSR